MFEVVIILLVGIVLIARMEQEKQKKQGTKKTYEKSKYTQTVELPFGKAPEPKPSTAIHSHDRLDDIPDKDHDLEAHWKQQLDGFLAAGLIDKAEYKTLYEQRKKCYHDDRETGHWNG